MNYIPGTGPSSQAGGRSKSDLELLVHLLDHDHNSYSLIKLSKTIETTYCHTCLQQMIRKIPVNVRTDDTDFHLPQGGLLIR